MSWNDCQKQINGFPGAKYKGFKKYETAVEALKKGHDDYWGKNFFETTISKEQLQKIGSPINKSLL